MRRQKMIKLIYIGSDFYTRSQTMMSPIYEEGTWERYDWGFVARDLRDGKSISIRPATDAEIDQAEQMLRKRWMSR